VKDGEPDERGGRRGVHDRQWVVKKIGEGREDWRCETAVVRKL